MIWLGMDLKTQHLPLDQDLETGGKIIPNDFFSPSTMGRQRKKKKTKLN